MRIRDPERIEVDRGEFDLLSATSSAYRVTDLVNEALMTLSGSELTPLKSV